MIERIPIESRDQWLTLRRQDITASTAGALLGLHPYVSAWSLWAEKTGLVPSDAPMNAAMERGLELEPIAIKRLQKLHPDWNVTQPAAYYRDPDARLGATPDCFVTRPERDGFGCVQIKSVEPGKFQAEWCNGENGSIEPPLWIVCQALVEAHLTGASWAYVAALVVSYGIELHLVEVQLHAAIIERVKVETKKFWEMIERGEQPPPDYGKDAALIEQLYKPIPDEVLDLTGSNELPALLDEREALSASKSAAEKRLKEIKGELIANLKDYVSGRVADGRIITAKRIHKKAYEVPATSYVDVRVKAP